MSEENKNIIFGNDIKSEKNQTSGAAVTNAGLKYNLGDEDYDKKIKVLRENTEKLRDIIVRNIHGGMEKKGDDLIKSSVEELEGFSAFLVDVASKLEKIKVERNKVKELDEKIMVNNIFHSLSDIKRAIMDYEEVCPKFSIDPSKLGEIYSKFIDEINELPVKERFSSESLFRFISKLKNSSKNISHGEALFLSKIFFDNLEIRGFENPSLYIKDLLKTSFVEPLTKTSELSSYGLELNIQLTNLLYDIFNKQDGNRQRSVCIGHFAKNWSLINRVTLSGREKETREIKEAFIARIELTFGILFETKNAKDILFNYKTLEGTKKEELGKRYKILSEKYLNDKNISIRNKLAFVCGFPSVGASDFKSIEELFEAKDRQTLLNFIDVHGLTHFPGYGNIVFWKIKKEEAKLNKKEFELNKPNKLNEIKSNFIIKQILSFCRAPLSSKCSNSSMEIEENEDEILNFTKAHYGQSVTIRRKSVLLPVFNNEVYNDKDVEQISFSNKIFKFLSLKKADRKPDFLKTVFKDCSYKSDRLKILCYLFSFLDDDYKTFGNLHDIVNSFKGGAPDLINESWFSGKCFCEIEKKQLDVESIVDNVKPTSGFGNPDDFFYIFLCVKSSDFKEKLIFDCIDFFRRFVKLGKYAYIPCEMPYKFSDILKQILPYYRLNVKLESFEKQDDFGKIAIYLYIDKDLLKNVEVFKKLPMSLRRECFHNLSERNLETLGLVPEKDRVHCFSLLDPKYRTPECLEKLIPKKDRQECFGYLALEHRTPECLEKLIPEKDRHKCFEYLALKHRTPECLEKLVPEGDRDFCFEYLARKHRTPECLEKLVPERGRDFCFEYLAPGNRTPEWLKKLMPNGASSSCFKKLNSKYRTLETLKLVHESERYMCVKYLDSKYRTSEMLEVVAQHKAQCFACNLVPEQTTYEIFFRCLNDKEKKSLVNDYNIGSFKGKLKRGYCRLSEKERKERDEKLALFDEFKGWYDRYQNSKNNTKREEKKEEGEIKILGNKHERSGPYDPDDDEKPRKIPKQESKNDREFQKK